MRPLILRMSAFGPFPKLVELDFSDLKGHSMFLITGPTGSGKTTILDAIMFALYGESSGKLRKSKTLRSHYADMNTETFVDFQFCMGQKMYRMERAPEQEVKKKRGEGTRPVGAKAALSVWDDGGWRLLSNRKEEIKELVHSIVGCYEEQFSQVVLLPQGEFRKLLVANTDERERLFHELFKTNAYSIVQNVLKEKCKALSSTIQERIDTMNVYLERESVSTLQELEKKSDELRKAAEFLKGQCQEAELEWTRLQRAHEAFSAYEMWAKRKEVSLAEQAELESRKESIKEKEDLLKRWNHNKLIQKSYASCQLMDKELIKLLQHIKSYEEEEQIGLAEKSRWEEEWCIYEEKKTSYEQYSELTPIMKEHTKFIDRSLKEWQRAEEEWAATKKKVESLKERWNQKEVILAALESDVRANHAYALSLRLEEGSPCPVCGSLEHPQRSTAPEGVVTDEMLEAEREEVKALREEVLRVESKLGMIGDRRNEVGKIWQDELRKLRDISLSADLLCGEKSSKDSLCGGDLHENGLSEEMVSLDLLCEENLQEGLDNLKMVLAMYNDEISRMEVFMSVYEKEGRTLQEKKETWQQKLHDIAIGSTESRSRYDMLLKQKKTHAEELEKLMIRSEQSLEESLVEVDENLEQIYTHEVKEYEQSVYAVRKSLEEVEEHLASYETVPLDVDAELLEKQKNFLLEKQREFGECRTMVKSLEESLQVVRNLETAMGEEERLYKVLSPLSSLANGESIKGFEIQEEARKLSFERYVIQSILDDVLVASNLRLKEMSRGRYGLERSSSLGGQGKQGLDLAVFDAYTGYSRPANTLSGGETFLASLSLAMGLSDVVQAYAGGIHLESIFIDEGFGTLDPDTLDVAMATLVRLQEGGRLVGIISHVPELKQRIGAQLVVQHREQGSSVYFDIPNN